MPRQTEVQRVMSAMGRIGGAARAKALTKKQRVAIASKAGQARWAKWREARANGGGK